MPLRMTLPTTTLTNGHKKAEAHRRYQSNRRTRARQPLATGFDFPVQLIGTTPSGNVTVYFDPSLGAQGQDLAQQIFAIADKTYADCQAFFSIPGQPVNVIIAALSGLTDGSGGAYHYGCSFNPGGDLYCDAAFGNPTLTNGLVVAELTESFMGAQAKGWDCGGSNGEALSRFLAEALSGGSNGALAAYSTGPAWDQDGRGDWIDATEPTDQNPDSTGCGVVYLYWMVSKGFTAAQIAQAGCPDGTLASNYLSLTGLSTAWADFIAAVSGLPAGVTSDDPWTGSSGSSSGASPARGRITVDPELKTVVLPPGWRATGAAASLGSNPSAEPWPSKRPIS